MRWNGLEKEWTPHESWVCAAPIRRNRKALHGSAFLFLASRAGGWLQCWLDSCCLEDPTQNLHGEKFDAAAFEFVAIEALPLNEVDFFFHCDVSGWLTPTI